jgi:hypothetical protein
LNLDAYVRNLAWRWREEFFEQFENFCVGIDVVYEWWDGCWRFVTGWRDGTEG